MDPIIPLADALTILGVEEETPDADRVSVLLNAMSDELRERTNRAFEGETTAYDETIRIRGAGEFRVSHVPVDPEEDITLTPLYFDGTEAAALLSTEYRLEDAAMGRFRIRPGATYLGRQLLDDEPLQPSWPEYIRAEYSVTGELPESVRGAIHDWLRDAWAKKDRPSDLASYATGEDEESYFASLTGRPPAALQRALVLAWRPREGGVI